MTTRHGITRTLAALLALATITAAPANAKKHSDDEGDFTDQICFELNTGKSLDQIANGITAGDSRYQPPISRQKVFDTVVLDGSCG